MYHTPQDRAGAYLDLRVHRGLLTVVFIIIVRVHADVVEGKFLLDAILECLALFQCERICLGDDRNHVDRLTELLQYHDVNGFERMSGGCDEVKAAVDTSILNVAFALSSQLLAQVCAMLILDVLDNRIPAAIVVNEISITGCVNDVEAQTHAVFFDDMRDGVDLGGAANRFGWGQAALAIDEV